MRIKYNVIGEFLTRRHTVPRVYKWFQTYIGVGGISTGPNRLGVDEMVRMLSPHCKSSDQGNRYRNLGTNGPSCTKPQVNLQLWATKVAWLGLEANSTFDELYAKIAECRCEVVPPDTAFWVGQLFNLKPRGEMLEVEGAGKIREIVFLSEPIQGSHEDFLYFVLSITIDDGGERELRVRPVTRSRESLEIGELADEQVMIVVLYF